MPFVVIYYDEVQGLEAAQFPAEASAHEWARRRRIASYTGRKVPGPTENAVAVDNATREPQRLNCVMTVAGPTNVTVFRARQAMPYGLLYYAGTMSTITAAPGSRIVVAPENPDICQGTEQTRVKKSCNPAP